jgi:S1-C subfamily serine protease
VNDVITSIDDVPVDTIDELLTRLRFMRAGDTASLEILRGNESLELEATMDLFSQ